MPRFSDLAARMRRAPKKKHVIEKRVLGARELRELKAIHVELLEQITAARKDKGMSQAAFLRAAGLSHGTPGKWKRGKGAGLRSLYLGAKVLDKDLIVRFVNGGESDHSGTTVSAGGADGMPSDRWAMLSTEERARVEGYIDHLIASRPVPSELTEETGRAPGQPKN